MTTTRTTILALAACCVLCALPAHAQFGVRFERYGVTDGLSNAYVRQILQDHRGFLWIGTEYGLNRFDGYDFEVYEHEPTDVASLQGAWIQRMHEDDRGVLWVALFVEGIARFDPSSATARQFKHDADDPTSISAGRVMALFEDRPGRVWMVTRAGVLNLFEPDTQTFRRYPVCDAPERDHVGANCEVVLIAEGPRESVWVATSEHGLLRLDVNSGDAQRVMEERSSSDSAAGKLWNCTSHESRITGASTGPSGIVWLGGCCGHVWRLVPATGDFQILAGPQAESPFGSIHSIVESKHHPGRLWLGSRCDGLARFDIESNVWHTYAHDDTDEEFFRTSLGSHRVNLIHEDRAGALWLGTQRGLFSLNPESELFRWHRFKPSNPFSMAPFQVTAILEDRSGVLWFGTAGGGLAKFNPGQRNFRHDYISDRMHGVMDRLSVRAIAQDADGYFWVGTTGLGLHRYDRAAQTAEQYRHDLNDPTSLSDNQVNAILPSRKHANVLWVGTGHGLDRVDLETRAIERLLPRDGMEDPISARALIEDDDGIVWAGTGETGVVRFDPWQDTFRVYACWDSTGTASCNIQAALYGSNGELWFGATPTGLHRYDRATDRMMHFVRDPGDPSLANAPRTILSMYESNGTLWLGTYSDGLVRYDPGTHSFRQFTRASGLPSNQIMGILRDGHGSFWISTNRGLSQFDPQTGHIKNYDVSDGIQANDFLHHSTWETSDGELFFGGIDGLTSFYPDSIVANRFVPPVVLTSLEVRDRDGQVRRFPVVDPPSEVTLDPHDRFFAFDYSALDYSNPYKNRYQHRLVGLDDDWTTPSSRRYGSYSGVPPGRYTLHLRGSNNDGTWNEAGVSLSIVVLPPFWRTTWFLALCVGALVLAAIGVHLARMKAQRARLRELEAVRRAESERVRKDAARDIHDELGHLVSRIALFSEIARRQVLPSQSDTLQRLHKITEFSRSLADGMADFVWTLDPQEQSLADVLLRLKDFGDDLYSKSGVRFTVRGLEPSLAHVQLGLPWRRHLTMLFKEAMNNALKHAHCRHVELRATLSEGTLTLALQDDGRGFIHNGNKGRGLHNLESRAQALGGALMIQTSPGAGTTVAFSGTVRQEVTSP